MPVESIICKLDIDKFNVVFLALNDNNNNNSKKTKQNISLTMKGKLADKKSRILKFLKANAEI